jgi:hypothetical protein
MERMLAGVPWDELAPVIEKMIAAYEKHCAETGTDPVAEHMKNGHWAGKDGENG